MKEVASHEDKHEHELIDNEVLYSFISHGEPRDGAVAGYVTRWDGEKLMEDKIRTAFAVNAKGGITGIVERTTVDVFNVGFDEQKEGKWHQSDIS